MPSSVDRPVALHTIFVSCGVRRVTNLVQVRLFCKNITHLGTSFIVVPEYFNFVCLSPLVRYPQKHNVI